MSEQIENQDVEIVEASEAATTLKPSNTTKSELLSQMMKAAAGMKKEDLSAFLTKTLAQVGKEDDSVPDTSAKNKASIAMKSGTTPSPSASTGAINAMKEDVDGLFGDEELSEDFKAKTATLFEAVVSNRVEIELARIQEEYDEKFEQELSEQVTTAIDELHEQVNSYLDSVVTTWMEENELAIEQGIRTEVTEGFMEGLKGLFAEHYIDVPENKVDLVSEMTEKLEQLETKLEEAVSENIKLNNMIQESQIEGEFDDIAEGLTDTQVEKLRSLSESVSYSNVEDYAEKVKIIKEQYFGEHKETKVSTGLINEEVIALNEESDDQIVVPEEMKQYVSAISKTTRK